MKKKIRKVSVYRVDHFMAEETADGSLRIMQSETEYDEDGRIIREAQFTGDGMMAEQYLMHYDYQGKPASMTILGEDGEALEVRRNEYDAKGRLVRTSVEYMDGSLGLTEYIFDDWEMLTARITYDEDRNIESRESYLHHEGNLILTERFNEEDVISFRQEEIYTDGKHSETRIWTAEEGEPYTRVIKLNEAGRKIAEMKYDSRDKLVERITIEEDQDGKLLKVSEENPYRKTITEYHYDKDGNLTGQVELAEDGSVHHQVVRTYNADMEPDRIRITFSRPDARLHNYSLEYDYEYY